MNFAVKAGANVGSFSNLPKIPQTIFQINSQKMVNPLKFRMKNFRRFTILSFGSQKRINKT